MILNITLLIVEFTRNMLANFMSFILLFNCERDLCVCIRQTHRHTLAWSPFPLQDFFTGSPLAVIYFFYVCVHICVMCMHWFCMLLACFHLTFSPPSTHWHQTGVFKCKTIGPATWPHIKYARLAVSH